MPPRPQRATGAGGGVVVQKCSDFVEVMDRAVGLVSSLLGLPENYKPLFLTGGASSQFFMTAMNLLGEDQKAYYVDTGTWSSKAIKEAKLYGDVKVVASSKEEGYKHIPKDYTIPSDGVYLHLTSNNTIYGTQFQEFPDAPIPIVCDMSSDIFSRPLPVEKFGIIYAGAQKNMGPAGTTLVIVDEDLLGKVEREIPTMLDYRTHIKKDSAFNTPPVYPIYVSMLVLDWLDKLGGVEEIEKRNQEKAKLLYDEIDRNPLIEGIVAKEDRSLMNATFVMKDESHNDAFLQACKDANCVGIKGHRSVGGFRASIYNAMPIESVHVLVEVMQDFEKKHG